MPNTITTKPKACNVPTENFQSKAFQKGGQTVGMQRAELLTAYTDHSRGAA